MQLYWTSTKSINGLKHFVVVNKYKINKKDYLEIVSVLDDMVRLNISKKDLEESGNWIRGWEENLRENIIIQEYKEFTLGKYEDTKKIILQKNSPFNIS